MYQVDLNMRRQKQQSKFHMSSRFCQGTFPDDECSLQAHTKCFRCPSSNLSKLPLNLTAWGNVRGGSREGRHLPPQDSPLRTSWSIPWALSRHSYEESHQQKFYWIYCYRSWILSAKSRRRKFSQQDNKGGCFYHFTLNHEQWALAGWGESLPGMKGKHVLSSEAQCALLFRGAGIQGLCSEATDSFYTEIWWSCRVWSGLEQHQPCQGPPDTALKSEELH